MSNELSGRIAIISGASSGIGEALARAIVLRGGSVVINARRAERLDALAEQLGPGRAVCVPGDAAEQRTIDALFDSAQRAFGRAADAVIVNAGRGLAGSLTTSDQTQWDEMFRTNYLGAARLMRSAADRLVRSLDPNPEGEAGKAGPWLSRPRDVVVIGSSVGRNISPFSSMYGSTKFAVHALAEALRREIGPRGIRVTTIEPAIVASEFQSVAGYDHGTFGAFMDRIGPVLMPDDVARTIAFAIAQPAHVHLNNIALRPTRQDYP
ncbi:MAG: SDR family oxidoreductase [Phycisphaeraceae bacterium]|nr:SDR family oxidoreductase [Phycisphaeraceae bacterium]